MVDPIMQLDDILASPQEFQLLQQINQPLPDDLNQKSKALGEKCKSGTATDREQTKFSQITEQIEMLAAKRVEALIQMANLRQIPFMQLVNDLGIQAPTAE